MDELRFAVRRLVARPAASLISIVALGCAIGAAAAAWSLISATLLHPVPVRDPGRLVVVGQRLDYGSARGALSDGLVYPRLQLIREAAIFEAAGAHWSQPLALGVATDGGVALKRTAGFVTSNFFAVLGVQVPLGRQFNELDDRRGATPVAILTDRYWHLTFGGDPSVIGRTIRIAGRPVTVVGVLERGFRGVHLGDSPDLFLPLDTIAAFGSPFTNYFADPNQRTSPTAGVAVVGRLRAGESREEALARLRSLRLAPSESAHLGLMDIETAALPLFGRRSLPQFTLLLGATVAVLLLIGCGAVGTLLLIRTEARREEFAMCMALGASRWKLARGIGVEGLLLAVAGGALALPLTSWLMHGIRVFQLPGRVDVTRLDLSTDARAVLACAASALAATSIVTLIAGVFGFTANVAEALRSRGATRITRGWTRTALVAAQVALALVLLAGAGLFTRSLIAALQLNAGVDASRLLTTYVSRDAFGRPSARDPAFFDELMGRLEHDPALASVAYSVSHGSMLGELTVDGVAKQYPSRETFDGVDRRYFTTVGLPLLDGREFAAADIPGSPPVAIVSQSFAHLIAPGTSAIGHRVTLPWSELDRPAAVVEIVGVVPDLVENVNALEPLAVYLPLGQVTTGASRDITARAAGDVAAARRSLVATVRDIDASVTATAPMTVEEGILRQMNAQQFGIVVLGALAGIAMLLTAMGTYVLAESMASMRLREMGIRASLGATRVQLGVLVVRETASRAGFGVLAGLGLVWAGSGFIRALLFSVRPVDPIALAGASGLIFAVAIVVSLRPALRVARVDVAQTLREP